nr:aminoglycoside phosphotransferase family protein [Phaeobacter italicus]
MTNTVARPLVGGRSNRVWRFGTVVVKLYARNTDNPLFANDPQRERAALQALGGTGMVPHYLSDGAFDGQQWLAYTHIPGETWSRNAGHVAQLLGRLHDQPAISGLPQGCNGSRALAEQTHHILGRCQGAETLLSVEPRGEVAPYLSPTLIHGDPVPGNIVAHDGTLTLIDWQCPQIGDPTEDLALFLSPAMQQVYRGAPLSAAEEAAFLDRYPDPQLVARYLALRPWYHWRMAAYCLWRDQRDGRMPSRAFDLELAALRACPESG